MATYYSQGSGNWSTLANWNDAIGGGGASPASIAAMSNNTFVIQKGHVVVQDVEDDVDCTGAITGWTTGIAGVTITGGDVGEDPGQLVLCDSPNSTLALTDLACADHDGPPYTVTSAAAPFVASDTGALLTIPASGAWVGGLYAVTYVDAGTITLTTDPTDGTDATGGVATLANRIYGFRLKAGAVIQGTDAAVLGRFVGGTDAVPMPADAHHTILALNTSSSTNGAVNGAHLELHFRCQCPIEPVYILSEDIEAGATELPCAGLRTGGSPALDTGWWKPGWEVTVISGALQDMHVYSLGQPSDYESCVRLAHHNPVGDGVIRLQSPLARSKGEGGTIALCRRNIEFRSAAGSYAFFYWTNTTTQTVNGVEVTSPTHEMPLTVLGCALRVRHTQPNNTASRGLVGSFATYVPPEGLWQGITWGIYDNRDLLVFEGTSTDCGQTVNLGHHCYFQGNAVVTGGNNAIYWSSSIYFQGDALLTLSSEATHDCITVFRENATAEHNMTLSQYGKISIDEPAEVLHNMRIWRSGRGVVRGATLGRVGEPIHWLGEQCGGVDVYGGECEVPGELMTINGDGYVTVTQDPSLTLWDYQGVRRNYPERRTTAGHTSSNVTFAPMPPGILEVAEMTFSQLREDYTTELTPQVSNFLDLPIWCEVGTPTYVRVWLRKNKAGMLLTPRAALLNPNEPLWSQTPLAQFVMSDSVDTWELATLTYTEEVAEREIILRVWGADTDAVVYVAHEVLPDGTAISYNPPASAVRSVPSYVDQFPVQAASCQTWMRAPLLRWTRNDDVTVEYVLSDSTGDLADLTGCGVTWSAETYGGDNLTVLTLGSGITLSLTNFGTISIVVPADSAMMSHDGLYHCDLQVETPYGQTTTIDKFRVKVEKDVPFEPEA